VAILAAVAAPALRTFFVRNTFSGIGNEFSGSILRARNEAVGKNICVTMCISNNVDTTSGNGPTCATSGQDWQVGWIVFLNPDCITAINRPQERGSSGTLVNKPQNMLLVRRGGNSDYSLMAQSSTRKIQFNARGNTSLSSAGEFDLAYLAISNQLTLDYGFNICLDKMGRTRSIPGMSNCNNF
jgi:type IV fimbrial biogenesis protein FimT